MRLRVPLIHTERHTHHGTPCYIHTESIPTMVHPEVYTERLPTHGTP